MKNYLIIIIIATFAYSCGTDQGGKKNYDYSIVNSSGVKVELIPTLNGVKSLERKIILENRTVFNKKHTDYPIYTSPLNIPSIFSDFGKQGIITHLEITFDNTKKIIYSECPDFICSNVKNIFHYKNNDNQTEVYTITPEDYQNAIDCGGNCN